MDSARGKILIIDDDPLMARMVANHLKVADYHTNNALDGLRGIQLAKEWHPDLVLLDVMMPGIDGFDTCLRIREFSSVPVIMLTAKGAEQDKVKGLDAGADDYIIKPFSAEELLARVRAVLRRANHTQFTKYPQRYFQHYDLTLDLARAEVYRNDEQIQLTATEYRLLQTLAESVGKVLSPEELLSRVWGVDYRREREILWVTLSRLRQKIEINPRKPIHVLTRQGLGYLMPLESKSSSPDSSPESAEE